MSTLIKNMQQKYLQINGRTNDQNHTGIRDTHSFIQATFYKKLGTIYIDLASCP